MRGDGAAERESSEVLPLGPVRGAGQAPRTAWPGQMIGANAASPWAAEPRVFIGSAVANWPSVPISAM